MSTIAAVVEPSRTEAAPSGTARTTSRSEALARRLEQGASALAALAAGLTDLQWHTPVSATDRRTVGTVVHHVATMYPIEIQAAQTLAAGTPIVGLTMDDVHAINAAHGTEYSDVSKDAALDLLARNSAAAAAAIRVLTDEELDRAAPASLVSDAPVTCQFMLEDHAVRHSYHHLAKIRKALNSR